MKNLSINEQREIIGGTWVVRLYRKPYMTYTSKALFNTKAEAQAYINRCNPDVWYTTLSNENPVHY